MTVVDERQRPAPRALVDPSVLLGADARSTLIDVRKERSRAAAGGLGFLLVLALIGGAVYGCWWLSGRIVESDWWAEGNSVVNDVTGSGSADLPAGASTRPNFASYRAQVSANGSVATGTITWASNHLTGDVRVTIALAGQPFTEVTRSGGQTVAVVDGIAEQGGFDDFVDRVDDALILQDLVPDDARPYITTRRAPTVGFAGRDLSSFVVTVDVQRFRAADPSGYDAWFIKPTDGPLLANAVLEIRLTVDGDGLVHAYRIGNATDFEEFTLIETSDIPFVAVPPI